MNANDRVRKHRTQLKEQCYGRLEISLGITLINQLRKMARFKGVPVRSVVQDALEAHLVEYRQLLVEGQRLSKERVRLITLSGISESQPEIKKYNQQLADYNERLVILQGIHSS